MTKSEVYKQLYDLSVHGRFNHQKWPFLKFKDYCNEKFKDDKRQSIIVEILLPDGWWYCAISHFKIKNEVIWDYHIPDTKEEQERLYGEVINELKARGESIYDL
mgnify:CR=1 FL=1